MRWPAALVVVLAGCNQVYGIESTRLSDGHEPDAPFACPADRPLRFSTLFHLAYPLDCQELSFAAAADHAVAMCSEPQVGLRVFEAASSGELTQSLGVSYTLFGEVFYSPRLSPDASELYLRVDTIGGFDDTQVIATRYDAYARSGGTWTAMGTLAIADQVDDALSSIAIDPDGSARALLDRSSGLTEWVRRGGIWMLERTYPTEFGAAVFLSPMLSRDGLQLTAIGGPTYSELAVLWGSRTNVDVAFTMLTPVPDLPVPPDRSVYLTENCGRAYFSGLDSVFYAQQQ